MKRGRMKAYEKKSFGTRSAQKEVMSKPQPEANYSQYHLGRNMGRQKPMVSYNPSA